MSAMNLSSSAAGYRRLVWGEIKVLIGRCRERVYSRYELMSLNEGDLRDIGLTRGEAEFEAAKPFWQK